MYRATLLILLTALAALFGIAAAAADDPLLKAAGGRYRIEPEDSRVAFYVSQIGGGPGIRGHFSDVRGSFVIDGRDLAHSTVEIVIGTGSPETGNERVDRFLRGGAVFYADRFPEATFRSTRVTRTGPDTAVIDGVLTARGVSERARFSARLAERDRRRIRFEVAGELFRSRFGMSVGTPAYATRWCSIWISSPRSSDRQCPAGADRPGAR